MMPSRPADSSHENVDATDELKHQERDGSPLVLTLRKDLQLGSVEAKEDEDKDVRTYINPAVVGPTTGVLTYGAGIGDKARESVDKVKEHVHNGVERVKEKRKGE